MYYFNLINQYKKRVSHIIIIIIIYKVKRIKKNVKI